jgi:hypothetical protein
VHVISPIDGAEVSRKFVEVRVEVTSYGARKDAWGWAREDDGSSGKHVWACLDLVREAFNFTREIPEERVSKCWDLSGSEDDPRTKFPIVVPDVEMTIQADYSARVRVLHGIRLEGATEIMQTRSAWTFGPDSECRARRARADVIFQVEGQPDPFHDHRMSPLCMDDTSGRYFDEKTARLGPFLSTASGFRGTFGVDHTVQEFGHGDTMMLHYVLSRHRGEFNPGSNFVELGCWAGVTSLTYGVAASLKAAHFHAYDIVDVRPEVVKHTWLPNMHHHILDVDAALNIQNAQEADAYPPDFADVLSKASLVMVDHNHRTRLEAAEALGQKFLRRDRAVTILVHDFPAGKTIAEWKTAMRAVGFDLMYEGLRNRLVSTLATFRRLPGRHGDVVP